MAELVLPTDAVRRSFLVAMAELRAEWRGEDGDSSGGKLRYWVPTEAART